MHNIKEFITEPRFKNLMLQLEEASTLHDVDVIIKRHNEIVLSDKESEQYSDSILSGVDSYLKVIDEDIEELKAATIRKKMGDLDKAISFAYIARNYFGKSQSWLLQRLNGSKVNGKEAHFNKSELQTLQDAIHDLGNRLTSVALV